MVESLYDQNETMYTIWAPILSQNVSITFTVVIKYPQNWNIVT